MIVTMPEESSETMPLFKRIDVNRLPPVLTAANEEEEGRVSSPNSIISCISEKRSSEWEEQYVEKAWSHSISDEEDTENARKKLMLSKDQSAILEESFKDNSHTQSETKDGSSKEIGSEAKASGSMVPEQKGKVKCFVSNNDDGSLDS